MKLTIVFEDGDCVVGKNAQGTLFYRCKSLTNESSFRPIDSYDLREDKDGQQVLVAVQPFAQDMPIT